MHDFSLFSHRSRSGKAAKQNTKTFMMNCKSNLWKNVCSPGLHEFLMPAAHYNIKTEIGIVLWRREKQTSKKCWENVSKHRKENLNLNILGFVRVLFAIWESGVNRRLWVVQISLRHFFVQQVFSNRTAHRTIFVESWKRFKSDITANQPHLSK